MTNASARFMTRWTLKAAVATGLALLAVTVGTAVPADAAAKPTGDIAVQLVDVDGHPLALAGFTASASAFGGSNVSAVTDSQGHARLTGIITGGYTVFASQQPVQSSLYASADRLHVVVKAGAVTSTTVIMAVGATVRGQVFGPDGKPAAGASISLSGAGNTDGIGLGYSVTAGADGRFTLTGLRTDVYTIRAGLAGSFVEDTAVWVTRVSAQRPGLDPTQVMLGARTLHSSRDFDVSVGYPADPGALVNGQVRLTNTVTGAVYTERTSGAVGVMQLEYFDVPSGRYTVQVDTVATSTTPAQVWWSTGSATPLTLDPSEAISQVLQYTHYSSLNLQFPN